jgi:lipopolysaccharide export system protein LptA
VRIEAPVRIDGTLNEYLVQSRSLVVTANFQITNDATVIEATLFSESLIQQ